MFPTRTAFVGRARWVFVSPVVVRGSANADEHRLAGSIDALGLTQRLMTV